MYAESEVDGIRGEAGGRKQENVILDNLRLDTALEKDGCAVS